MCKVLVIDDCTDTTESLEMLLTISGHRAFVANDGRTGLQLAHTHHPDVVLLDLRMPQPDGYMVCREMRREPWAQQTLIVAISGLAMDKDRVDSMRAGCDHHFRKPMAIETLLGLIAQLHAKGAPRDGSRADSADAPTYIDASRKAREQVSTVMDR
jgi:DNA-binding response OmpR family regulator